MGFFDRAFGSMVAGVPGPTDDYWYQAVGELSVAGVPVTPEAAQKVSAFYRGVDLLSTSLAMLPLNIYEKLPDDSGSQVASDHPLQSVLHDEPNGYQDSFQWRRMLARRLIMKGNAYCETVTTIAGPFGELRPITVPVKPKLQNGRVYYYVRESGGQTRTYLPEEIFHLCGPSDDGVEGVGVVQWARESLGLAQATESYAARLFSQGALYGTVLKLPTKPDDDARESYKKSFREATSKLSNAHGVLITHSGADVSRVSLTGEETQFIASRKFSIEDIARWLGIPPHMLGSLDRATFSNIEQQGTEFVTYSLGPWLTLWEQAIKRQLILDKSRFYAEFVRDALVRGDIAARWQAYQIAVSTGTFTRNEVRRLENKPALEGLDTPLDPAYLSGKQLPQNSAQPPAQDPAAVDDTASEDAARARAAHASFKEPTKAQCIVEAAARRLLITEVAFIQKARVRHGADDDAYATAVAAFYSNHASFVERTLLMSPSDARKYCAGQASQVLADTELALWKWQTDSYAAGLAAIAMEDAA